MKQTGERWRPDRRAQVDAGARAVTSRGVGVAVELVHVVLGEKVQAAVDHVWPNWKMDLLWPGVVGLARYCLDLNLGLVQKKPNW